MSKLETPIRPCAALDGAKRAVLMAGTYFVSPAMYELIENANEAELKHLLENIGVLELPGPPRLRDMQVRIPWLDRGE